MPAPLDPPGAQIGRAADQDRSEPDARRGVGTAAVAGLLELGFHEPALHRIYLHVFAATSLRAGLRAGGLPRGVGVAGAACIDGAWIDVVLMALLAVEFHPGT